MREANQDGNYSGCKIGRAWVYHRALLDEYLREQCRSTAEKPKVRGGYESRSLGTRLGNFRARRIARQRKSLSNTSGSAPRRELKLGERAAVPWREAAARWLTETKKRTKAKDGYMLAWFGGYLDDEPLSAIDRDTIEDLREGLREEGASESTVNRYMALLRAILRKARDEWRYIDNIPKVPMYGEDAAEPRWLRNDEFERLKRELPPHLKLAAEFAVLTGLRMRSMLQLTWDRVDLEARRAWVPQSQMKGGRSFGFPLCMKVRPSMIATRRPSKRL